MRFIFLLLCLSIISCSQNNISTEIEIPTTSKNSTTQNIEIEKGDVVKLNGSVQFSNGQTTKDVTWESLSPEYVKVESDGNVTALKEGNAKLKIIANQDKTKFSIIEITVIAVKNRDVQISTGNTSKFLKDLDPTLFNENNTTNPTNIIPSSTPSPSVQPINYESKNLTIYTYDINDNLLNDVSITIKSLDKKIIFSSKITTNNGTAIFKNVPIDTLISISVSKIGYNTKERTEVLKGSNDSRLDFGGSYENSEYALQQEPEVSKITVNKKPLTDFTINTGVTNPTGTEKPNIILSNAYSINVDFYFSKPIDKDSFENAIQIISQPTKNNINGLIFSKENKKLYFSWNYNDSSVSVVFGNNYDGLSSIIYQLKLKQVFYDKANIYSLKNKSINLNGTKKSDCLIIQNDNKS